MRHSISIVVILAALLATSTIGPRGAAIAQGKKEYLSDAETDKIRDAETPSDRIRLFVTFAEDRLKKFQYELTRQVPEYRRSEILNGLLNGYVGCMDDAADQIAVAQEKQADIHNSLKLLQNKGKEFLDALEKIQKDGPELDVYRETLEDAIDGTKDALADVNKAEKEMAPPPVRRKQP
jgi:chromosome segregation ATPase